MAGILPGVPDRLTLTVRDIPNLSFYSPYPLYGSSRDLIDGAIAAGRI